MNNATMMMCPHCEKLTALVGEPREGVLYACSQCETPFKLVRAAGRFVTAHPGADEKMIKDDLNNRDPFSILDDIMGKNKGWRVPLSKLVMLSNPLGDNWVEEAFKRILTGDLDRSSVTMAELLACPCDDCVIELARRRGGGDTTFTSDCDKGDRSRYEPEGEPLLRKATPTVPDIMAEAANTFRERNALYGNSYHSFGKTMLTLFPDGLNLKTEDDWNRAGVYFFLVSKIVRYAANFSTGGHVDSAHDSGVYSFMLEELTRLRENAS